MTPLRPYNDEAGDWRGLDSPTDALRYAAIAEILDSFRGDGSVLDVGCGEALLRAYLPVDSKYTGIEASATAVRMALERNPATKIIHARAESFDARGDCFDSIVFNEMLYYVTDPVGLLRKYIALLRSPGMILCSIYQKPGAVPMRRKLRHWLDRRRPISNIHCEQMARDFMAREGWPILEDRIVMSPGGTTRWHIWLATPYHLPAQKVDYYWTAGRKTELDR